MANRTDTSADTVHGTNPQYLVDRIVRLKIHNDAYWKEFCFALTNETLIDQAASLDYVAGTYGGRRRPAKFLCLILKMLQIQPDEDVVMEYIKQPDLKYLRALGVVYLRLTGRAKTVYETLEPLYADYRKLRYRNIQGKLSLIHMDELIDWLFNEETIVDVTMPALPKREILEFSDMLKPRESILDDDLEDLEELEAANEPQKAASRSPSPAPAVATAAVAPAAPSCEVAEAPERRSKSRHRSRSRRQENERRNRSRRSPSRSGSRDRKDRKKEKDKKEKQREKERDREREKERAREKEKEDKREKKDKKESKGKKDKKEKRDDRSDEEEEKVKEPRKKGLFKGDDKPTVKESKQRSGDGKSNKEKDGLSVDQWNDVRKQLGLKPLDN